MAAIAGRLYIRSVLPGGNRFAAIFFYWIRVKVVQQQQLTCLKLDRPNGPSYSTDELLNTFLVGTWFHVRYSSAV